MSSQVKSIAAILVYVTQARAAQATFVAKIYSAEVAIINV